MHVRTRGYTCTCHHFSIPICIDVQSCMHRYTYVYNCMFIHIGVGKNFFRGLSIDQYCIAFVLIRLCIIDKLTDFSKNYDVIDTIKHTEYQK